MKDRSSFLSIHRNDNNWKQRFHFLPLTAWWVWHRTDRTFYLTEFSIIRPIYFHERRLSFKKNRSKAKTLLIFNEIYRLDVWPETTTLYSTSFSIFQWNGCFHERHRRMDEDSFLINDNDIKRKQRLFFLILVETNESRSTVFSVGDLRRAKNKTPFKLATANASVAEGNRIHGDSQLKGYL